ncbi:MAG: carbohydrate kinase family protein [Planctomycetota bacterium]
MTKERRQYVCVGLGEILWDMLPAGKQLGGAPANFAYHAQALGAQGVVVSCVGDDELGQEIITLLDELGLDRSYLAADRHHPTGTVTVQLDENGKPDYTIHENVAWDFIPWEPRLAELAALNDAVCFGSLCQRSQVSHSAVRDFLDATRPECIRLFDINLRQSYFNKGTVRTMLELSNVLKLNDEELPVVAKLLDLAGSQDELFAQLTENYGLRMIAVTRGAHGSRLYAQGRSSEHRGFPAHVADTVGAGDSFAAAIALGLLHGRTLDEINEFANRLASFVCCESGATPRLPLELAKEFGLS